MAIGDMIYKLRGAAGLSQERFAELCGVSRQSVQKWESNVTVPELEKLIKISKYFDIALDALVFESDARITEELQYHKALKPHYANIPDWESYSSNLMIEYRQCIEEGLALEAYEDVFSAVSRLPKNEIRKKMGDVLFEVVMQAKTKEDYPYIEPSALAEIKDLRRPSAPCPLTDASYLEEKVHGAWMGRIVGCLLGKTVEGIKTEELIPFLQQTGNYPMHRYILYRDLTEDICRTYSYRFANRCYADRVDGMPVDDDTNYLVMAQQIIEMYGRDFTPYDVSRAWLSWQCKDAYCTAERVAYCNFVKGFEPPASARYKNPYREWIGAQIRGDYFGYINPGRPEQAAEMAFRDASISHTKNGIYGEMFVAAMLAVAACTDDVKAIILGGLGQIPSTSRLYHAVMDMVEHYENGRTAKESFATIHATYDEHNSHDWCHTISNAMIVVAALLYGGGDFGRSICMAVETGFDTDCNGATVGSILGMAKGIGSIDASWTEPIRDILHTSLFGVGTVKISDCVKQTMKHIRA